MRAGVGSVQTYADTLNARVHEPFRDVGIDGRAICSQHHAKTQIGTVSGDGKDVLSHKRLAPAQHDHRSGKGGDLGQQIAALLEIKLIRAAILHGGCSAVDALQIAAIGRFPEDQPELMFLGGRVRLHIYQFTPVRIQLQRPYERDGGRLSSRPPSFNEEHTSEISD